MYTIDARTVYVIVAMSSGRIVLTSANAGLAFASMVDERRTSVEHIKIAFIPMI